MAKSNWLIFARRTHALEKQYVPKIVTITQRLRKQFIADLQAHGKDFAIGNIQLQMIAPDLTPLIQSIYKTAGLTGAKIVADEIRQAVKKGEKAGGFGRNEAWIREVMKYLQIHMLGFIQDISDTMRSDMIAILQKGIDDNLTIPEIVQRLQSTGLIQSRAKVIARTEIVRAANVGHSVAARSFPYEVNKKWSAAVDHRTRHSHVYINNHMVDETATFRVPVYEKNVQVGWDEMQYPGDVNAHASNTINCFLPDELTNVNPKIIKRTFRSRYNGKVVTIQTSGGKKFTCTPNHPILTTFGWVAAGELTNGDNLVKSSFINDNTLPEFNVNNTPATFKQVFDAFNIVGVSVRMPRAVVNFYGDLPDSDVDIVSVNSELRDRRKPRLSQSLDKNIFKDSHFRKTVLFTLSLFNRVFMVELFRKISNGFVSFSNQLLSLFNWSLSHSYKHGFASVSNFYSLFPESSINNVPANTVSFSELLNAYSTFVVPNNLVNRNIFTDSPHLNAIRFESFENISGTDAENVSDFLDRFTGVIDSESVVKVESKFFNGHVYTFETINQMYDINGYVARNCRCRVIYEPKRDTAGNLIMRQTGQAPVIPMSRPTVYEPAQIAAILKDNVTVTVEK